jgi:hypothetical protein
MQLITGMYTALQGLIPGQIGRYDDAYNPNCVGDTFQSLHTPTILFEAGHTGTDYQREETREYIFHALIEALEGITHPQAKPPGTEEYFAIPENQKVFFDILIKNVHHINPEYDKRNHFGILFQEVLHSGEIIFEPTVEACGTLENRFGHATFNCLNSRDVYYLTANEKLKSLLI